MAQWRDYAATHWSITQMAGVLQDLVPLLHNGSWYAVERNGQSMRLSDQDHYLWLALTGGHPQPVAMQQDALSRLNLRRMLLEP